jgi:hypothetical protein
LRSSRATTLACISEGLLIWEILTIDAVTSSSSSSRTASSISSTYAQALTKSYKIAHAYFRVYSVADFLSFIAAVLLVVVLAEVGMGFRFVLAGGQRSAGQGVMRKCSIVIATLTSVVALATYGYQQNAYTPYYNFLTSHSINTMTGADQALYSRVLIQLAHDQLTINQLVTAMDSVIFAANFVALIYAGFVLHKCQRTTLYNVSHFTTSAYEATWCTRH